MTLVTKYNINDLLTFKIQFLLIIYGGNKSMQVIFPIFIYTFTLILILVPIAYKIGLVDTPNGRKHHVGSIPLVGGVAIFIVISSYLLLFMPIDWHIAVYLFSGAILLIVGVFDDFFDINVRFRLIVQFICAFVLVGIGGLFFESYGNLFGLGVVQLGGLGAVLTILFIVTNINSYNMIDGIDGLLGTVSLVSFVTLAFLMSYNSSHLAVVPIVISSTIVAYLLFNFNFLKALPKIFIGDSGATLLGLTICWLIIMGAKDENSFRPIMALYIVAIPTFDLIFNVISRIRRGVSPTKPGRDHVHHRLISQGFTASQTVCIIGLFSIVVSGLGILGEIYQVPEYFMLGGIVGLFFLFSTYFFKTKSMQIPQIQPAE